MDKLTALKYFCIAAEALQFRETALRLSVSPQVVTRIIAELEDELGAILFIRNTRNMKLTDFGERFLPKAQQYLMDGEILFANEGKQDDKHLKGVVRISVLSLPENDKILLELLSKITDYPELKIEWRVNSAKLNIVENQIDIGLRIGFETEPLIITRKICNIKDKLVISPILLKKLGKPKSLYEILECFPTSSLINSNNGRPWGWPIHKNLHVFPKNIRFITDDPYSELSAALSGSVCALISSHLCSEYLKNGQLIELLPEIEKKDWPMYLYRPQRTITALHVVKVFDWLSEILSSYYSNTNS